MKIGFSGHETFVCRQFWLKKGFDYIKNGNSFSRDEAVVELGVGRNMVSAIRFWLKGFDILDKEHEGLTELGSYLFRDGTGKDPFLEDTASLWLLHYSIIKNEKVFIFNSFFNEFAKEKIEFTKEHLITFLKRKTEESDLRLFSAKTYESDANVFIRTYLRSIDGKADIEDETSNLLTELNLITPFTFRDVDNKLVQWYKLNQTNREEVPVHLIMFAIMDKYENSSSIAFNELLEGVNAPGAIFSITESGLENKLREAVEHWPMNLIYNSTAGNRVLQIRKPLDKWLVLNEYYG